MSVIKVTLHVLQIILCILMLQMSTILQIVNADRNLSTLIKGLKPQTRGNTEWDRPLPFCSCEPGIRKLSPGLF
jgi:hypothetical protein